MHLFSPVDFMSSVDHGVVTYLNSFAHQSYWADYFVVKLESANWLKGGVLMTAYWWLWFRAPEDRAEPENRNPRDNLLYALLICVPVVLISRLMALLLPFRLRPIDNPQLHLKLAFVQNPAVLRSWSSFPSDHAALFFALATGVYLTSRRLGWLMYLYTAVVIALPRVYLGIHYPSDILAGALLGVVAGSTVRIVALRRVINWPAQRLLECSPGLFYASLFQLSYQTIELYDPLRHVGLLALKMLHIFVNRR